MKYSFESIQRYSRFFDLRRRSCYDTQVKLNREEWRGEERISCRAGSEVGQAAISQEQLAGGASWPAWPRRNARGAPQLFFISILRLCSRINNAHA